MRKRSIHFQVSKTFAVDKHSKLLFNHPQKPIGFDYKFNSTCASKFDPGIRLQP
ncbi:hypothetical protein [Pedobacter endophyticus]|uniref:Uncharacterized protein n=1 Tax=Pedobacter endophyticus TaxID=2789740 RepID=A0A7S9L0I9_9SPHI|nr:hypothetical protein [Pedobacter endophyticus]QPH39926.1 hypothetical protein IZT61_01160 [Pedobacter endophyticus]